MKNNFNTEAVVAVVLAGLLILILNPMHFWMPDMAHITALVMLLVIFGVYSIFVLREKVRDERDVLHRMFAARAAYFVGTTLLIIGVFVGALADRLDPWLVATLVAMILTKIATRLYGDKHL